MCSLLKNPTRHPGTNFGTSSARFAPSFVWQPGLECTQIVLNHQNISLGSNGVDRVRSLQKFRCDFMAKFFTLIAPVQPVLHKASCSNETIQNAHKHYETQQYMSLGSNRVGRLHSLRKIPKRLHGTNLCISCTSSTRFAPSFV